MIQYVSYIQISKVSIQPIYHDTIQSPTEHAISCIYIYHVYAITLHSMHRGSCNVLSGKCIFSLSTYFAKITESYPLKHLKYCLTVEPA